MKKRLFTLLVALVAMTVSALADELYVGGKQVSLSGSGSVTVSGGDIKSGTVTYDRSSKTLTLKNVTITRSGNNNRGIRSSVSGLKVVFSGTNKITTTTAAGLRFEANATITGSGTVTVTSNETALYVYKNTKVTISGQDRNRLTLNLSGQYGIQGEIGSTGEKVSLQRYVTFTASGTSNTIKNLNDLSVSGDANVTLKGNISFDTIDGLAKLTLSGGAAIDLPLGGKFNSSKKTVVRNNSTTGYTGNITIKPATAINSTNFPNPTFRSYVAASTIDQNSDSYLSNSEIQKVTKIDVTNKGISDLTGIGYFTALTTLLCHDNSLTSLDVSNNTALTTLTCDNNSLSTLDVTKNTALTQLTCKGNGLGTLDVSKNTALTKLYCDGNSLTSLKVSTNSTGLKELTCVGNQIKGDNMTALVNGLPEVANGTFLVCAPQSAVDNVITPAQVQVAKKKGWYVMSWLSVNGEDIYADYDGCPGVDINSTNFPDANFRAFLKTADFNDGDNYLTDAEIKNATMLEVNEKGITNLKGIEFFTSMWFLDCSDNELTSLDVSKNTALTMLACANNKLQSLDVSKNTNLGFLACYNNQLTSLDLSKNTALTELDCFLNQIKGESMDALIASLPNGTDCEFVAVSDGDLEQNVCTGPQAAAAKQKGWNLSCWYCNSFVANPFEGGVTINEYNFPDVTFRSEVLSLDSDADGMLSDDDIQAAKELDVSEKGIKNLTGIEYFTALKYLDCGSNSIESLDVSKNTSLTILKCYVNDLKSLDVSKNTALTVLYCNINSLESLDVSKNTALTELYCNSNGLKSLDVTKNTALTTLYCEDNDLTSLDVTKNTALTRLHCYGNQIKGSSMDNLVNSLPNTQGTLAVCRDGATKDNVITKAQVNVATDKGWKVKKFGNLVFVDYAGAGIDIPIDATNFPDEKFRNYLLSQDYGKDGILTDEEIDGITKLDVNYKHIQDLTGIEFFTALTCLICYSNSLKFLDVSKNTALKELSCNYTELKSLDVSKNTALTDLICNCNDLESLDVSKNTALRSLYCGNNCLKSLDVSKNTSLIFLECAGNQIEGSNMDNLVNGLPDTQGTLVVCDDHDNPDNVITKAQVKVATDKGWKVQKNTKEESGYWKDVDYAGLGDVNGDNQISQADLDLLVQIVMGQQPAYVYASSGDFNNDGKTDAADVVIMVNILKSIGK